MNLLAVCAEQGLWRSVQDLVWAMEDYLDMQGYWTERMKAIEIGVKAAQELDDRRDEGAFLGNLGNAYSDLGQVERAIESYEQALAIAREIGDRRGEAIRSHNTGDLYKDQGNIPLARQYLEQSLAIFEEIKSPYAEESRRLLGELG